MRPPPALAVLHFPYPPRALDPWRRWDLALALQQIGRALAAGTPFGGTVVVPFQRRETPMKIAASYSGPDGRKDWKFEMEYEDLPPEYVLEIASTARAFLNFVKNLAGGAASSDRAYAFEFSYKADDKAPKAAGEYDELLKGSVKATNLLYSQVVEAQKAGIELQTRLLQGAEMEIKSGQRE